MWKASDAKKLILLNYSLLILNTGPSGGNLSSTLFTFFFGTAQKIPSKCFDVFFSSSSFNFCSDFVEKYFEITKNRTKPGLKSCTWEKTSQTKMPCRTCSSLDLEDRTHWTIYSKSDEFWFVIDDLTKKKWRSTPSIFNNPKTLKNDFLSPGRPRLLQCQGGKDKRKRFKLSLPPLCVVYTDFQAEGPAQKGSKQGGNDWMNWWRQRERVEKTRLWSRSAKTQWNNFAPPLFRFKHLYVLYFTESLRVS